MKTINKITIERETVQLPVTPHTFNWNNGYLTSRENGEQYYPQYDPFPAWRGMPRNIGYGFGQQFDRAVTSPDGKYTLIYTNLGTKGLLLKGAHEVIREVNRSYYCADVYEYPATFLNARGRTFLVHCPLKYCRLDFEDVETGEIVTMHPDRQPQDFFHSRLEISPGKRWLISKGWGWHPVDLIAHYTIEDCLNNPLLLDARPIIELKKEPEDPENIEYGDSFEFSTASFINDEWLLIKAPGDSTPLGFWNMNSEKIVRRITVEGKCGNLLAIDDQWAWDLFEHPKLIHLETGKIEWAAADIDSGKQNSSIIGDMVLPVVAWDRETGRLAVSAEHKVEVLTTRR
jgi:hypothetical protein